MEAYTTPGAKRGQAECCLDAGQVRRFDLQGRGKISLEIWGTFSKWVSVVTRMRPCCMALAAIHRSIPLRQFLEIPSVFRERVLIVTARE